jgi:uncharacterized membrane protein HdeD (DUF308 family)
MDNALPDELKAFRSLWWLFMVFGVLAAIAGILLIFWPDISLVTLAVLLGIFLLVDGAFDVVAAIFGKGEGRVLLAILGVLSFIAGVILVKHPFTGLVALVIIVGAWFIVSGVVRFVAAFSDREYRGTNIAIGVLDIVAGVIVLAWPDLGLKTMAILAGIVLVIRGIAFIYGGWMIRKLPADGDLGGPAPAVA